MDRFDNISETALNWHQSGVGAVLATVVETWGSAPRRVGAQLAISGQGQIEGSVSGGCVEGAVIVEAMEALEDGSQRRWNLVSATTMLLLSGWPVAARSGF